jgi:hypothetical protein
MQMPCVPPPILSVRTGFRPRRLPSRTRLRRLEAKACKWLGSATRSIRRSVSMQTLVSRKFCKCCQVIVTRKPGVVVGRQNPYLRISDSLYIVLGLAHLRVLEQLHGWWARSNEVRRTKVGRLREGGQTVYMSIASILRTLRCRASRLTRILALRPHSLTIDEG